MDSSADTSGDLVGNASIHENTKLGTPKVFKLLSLVLGTLSVVQLIKHGFEMHSFAAPLQLVLDYYETLVHILVGWTEPYLHALLLFIHDLTNWQLKLDPNWKHIFVLLMLFFGAFARHLSASTRTGAIILWACGVIVSLATSVWLGVEPVLTESSDPVDILMHALVTAVPLFVVGLFFGGSAIWYAVDQARLRRIPWWKVLATRPAIPFFLVFLVVAIAVIAFWIGGLIGNFNSDVLLLQPLLQIPRPLLVGLGFIGVAAFFLVWGALNAIAYARETKRPWAREFRENAWTAVGVSMISVMGGAATFLVCNAGLGKLGL